MNPTNPRYGYGAAAGSQALFDEGLRRHMLRVYNYMGIGLVVTGIVALIVGTTPALYVPIFQSPLKWVVMLAPLAFVFFFSFRIQSMSASTVGSVNCWVMNEPSSIIPACLLPSLVAPSCQVRPAAFGSM